MHVIQVIGRFGPYQRVVKGHIYSSRKRREANGPGWSPDDWKAILTKYGNKCLCCGGTERLLADHVIPLKRGGKHSLDNIQPLCWSCNTAKGLLLTDYR